MGTFIKRAKTLGFDRYEDGSYPNELNCCTHCKALNYKKEYFCTHWQCNCHNKQKQGGGK